MGDEGWGIIKSVEVARKLSEDIMILFARFYGIHYDMATWTPLTVQF